MSETVSGIAKVSAAYTAAYAEMTNATKDRKNPHLGNDYATLESVLSTVRPVLARHGLSIYQAPGEMSLLGPDLVVISVLSILMHTSGEVLTVKTQVPVAPGFDKRSGKSVVDAQRAGSAITYARRYALSAICGITQQDDDGEAASGSGAADAEPDVAGLKARISASADVEALDALKDQVRAAGDRTLIQAFVARQRELAG